MSCCCWLLTAHAVFCSIFPSPDQQLTTSLKPAAPNTGGSLPDLTNIQFPPPLPTPLDSDDAAASALFGPSGATQTVSRIQGNSTVRYLLTSDTFFFPPRCAQNINDLADSDLRCQLLPDPGVFMWDCFCVLGRSEHVSACSNHGNAAWAGQHGSSYPECRRIPEPAALPHFSPPQSLSGSVWLRSRALPF